MTQTTRNPPRAVLFDLDGVLVDTMPSHFASWRQIAAQLGVELSASELESFRGVKRELCLDRILEHCAPVDDARFAQLLEEKNVLYLDALAVGRNELLLPGSRRILSALQAHGVPVGLVSASKNAATILRYAGLNSAFDAVSDGHFPGPPKPAPDQIFDVAQRLGFTPNDIVVFEDAPAGLEAAQIAGALGIGIGSTVHGHASADYWFPDLFEASCAAPLAGLLAKTI